MWFFDTGRKVSTERLSFTVIANITVKVEVVQIQIRVTFGGRHIDCMIVLAGAGFTTDTSTDYVVPMLTI